MITHRIPFQNEVASCYPCAIVKKKFFLIITKLLPDRFLFLSIALCHLFLCYICYKYSLLQCCQKCWNICWISRYRLNNHFDLSQNYSLLQLMYCRSENGLESKNSNHRDRIKEWDIGNSDRILFALVKCIVFGIC